MAGISVEYYTRLERGNARRGSRTRCSTPWAPPSNSTTPSGRTCSISCAPRTRARPAARRGPAARSSGHRAHRRRDVRRRRLRPERTRGHPVRQRARGRDLLRRCTATPCGRRTRRASCSSIRERGRSTRTGRRSPTRPSPCSAAQRAQPVRPRAVGPRRPAFDAQRRVPRPLGEPRRSLPSLGHQAPPPLHSWVT